MHALAGHDDLVPRALIENPFHRVPKSREECWGIQHEHPIKALRVLALADAEERDEQRYARLVQVANTEAVATDVRNDYVIVVFLTFSTSSPLCCS